MLFSLLWVLPLLLGLTLLGLLAWWTHRQRAELRQAPVVSAVATALATIALILGFGFSAYALRQAYYFDGGGLSVAYRAQVFELRDAGYGPTQVAALFRLEDGVTNADDPYGCGSITLLLGTPKTDT